MIEIIITGELTEEEVDLLNGFDAMKTVNILGRSYMLNEFNSNPNGAYSRFGELSEHTFKLKCVMEVS